jgi:hypothetical protein
MEGMNSTMIYFKNFVNVTMYPQYNNNMIIKIRINVLPSNSASEYISKRVESRLLKRALYTRVQRSIIHSSQEREATQVSIDRGVDKQDAVCIFINLLVLS